MKSGEIGKRICELRKSYKMTKRFMAEAIGVSYNSVCSYEYGTRIPSDEVKIRIAKLFGVSVESIFYANEDNKML